MKAPTRRQSAALALLLVLAVAASLGRLLIDRDPNGALGLAWPQASYASFRWSALAAGALIGTALAVSGVLLQALLRNPLASPFILGVSSGAGLGIMVALYLHWLATGSSLMPTAGLTPPAIIGALGVLAIVFALGRRRGLLDPVSLILVGVVVLTICGAGMMFFQHLVPFGLRGQFTTWLMGHVPETTPTATLIGLGAATLIGAGLAMLTGPAMDAAALGDDEARSVGLALDRLRAWLFILAGALAALTVVLAGPIAFIGLIAPHVARMLAGPHHTGLVPAAALCGIVLVVGADAAAQALDFGSGRMPIGIFTALIGGPLFIWLLLSGRGEG